MFEDGATPSKLIRFIFLQHRTDSNWHSLVQQYFRDAFLVPLVRITNDQTPWNQADLSHWDLNIHLLHRMIENRPKWNQHSHRVNPGQPLWLDSLVATDEPKLIRESDPPAELAESWSDLAPNVKEYIQRITGNANALYERVLILARLTERLQQRAAQHENPADEIRPVHQL